MSYLDHLERSHSVLKSTFCPTNQKVWDDHMFRETLWKRSVKLMHATSDFFMIISLWCFQVQLIRITYFLLLISRARMCINHFQEQGKNQCSNRSICVYIITYKERSTFQFQYNLKLPLGGVSMNFEKVWSKWKKSKNVKKRHLVYKIVIKWI